MAFVLDTRVRETSTTTGTGTYTLLGAVVGFQAFSAIGNTNTTWYSADNGTDWEEGIGTYTLAGTTLARTTILASSNADAAVNWGAGTKTLRCTLPASQTMVGPASAGSTAIARFSGTTGKVLQSTDLQVSATGYTQQWGTGVGWEFYRPGADANPTFYNFIKNRHATDPFAFTVLVSGDVISEFVALGTDGDQAIAAAKITMGVDATPSNNDMPGFIKLFTTADGAASPTDRLTLDSAGVLKPSANDGVSLGTTALSFSDLFLASGGVINWNAGNVTLTHAAGLLTVAGGGVVLAAGTTGLAPLKQTTGTNLTTAAVGAREFDGKVFYQTAVASGRQVEIAHQIIALTAAYTLTSQTGAQKMFNAPAGGALTLAANTTYRFSCMFSLTAMSATSGSFGFALGGTATYTRQRWTSIAKDTATAATAEAPQYTMNTAANVTLCTASTATVGSANIEGIIRVGTAGTCIPSVSLTTAAAAIVGIDSFFEIWPLGADTVQSVGNWA